VKVEIHEWEGWVSELDPARCVAMYFMFMSILFSFIIHVSNDNIGIAMLEFQPDFLKALVI